MPDFQPTLKELTLGRRYDPAEIWGDAFDLDKFEDYGKCPVFMWAPSEEMGLCGCCGRHLGTGDTVMIAIDGVCRGKDSSAKMSCGIFANVGSRFNLALTLDDDSGPSKQRAKILAATLAVHRLLALYTKYRDPRRPKEVIIKTDSGYLVNGITPQINKWRSRGHPNQKKEEASPKPRSVQEAGQETARAGGCRLLCALLARSSTAQPTRFQLS